MRRVSYQSVLGTTNADATGVYVRLGDDAIRTKRKDARKEVSAEISKAQAAWLKEALALSGPDIDEGVVLRALVDLGMELDIDWAVLASGTSLRAAMRTSVMVRRRTVA